MSPSRKKVCIVIPAYNEASVIRGVVKDTVKAMKSSSYQFEVVAVDDGSSDATAAEAKAGGATIIKHLLNSGAGAATRTGLKYASANRFDIVATMDADGQHDPDDLLKVIRRVSSTDADFVIGSRLIQSNGMPWYRVLGNKGLSLVTFIIFGVNVTDSQSGLKAFSQRALSVMDYHSNNFAFCSEMLWRARQQGLSVEEVPIRAIYSDYSLAKGQRNINALNILRQMLKRRILEIFDA